MSSTILFVDVISYGTSFNKYFTNVSYFILYFILTFPLIVFIKSVSYMYICIILHFWINLGFFQAKICPKTREPCAGKCSSAKGIIAKIKTPEGDWYMPNNLVKIDNYSQNNKQ